MDNERCLFRRSHIMFLPRPRGLALLLAQHGILPRYPGSLILALLLETCRRNRPAIFDPPGYRFLRVLDVASLILLFGKPRLGFDRGRQDVRLSRLELRIGRILAVGVAAELFGRRARFGRVLLCHARSFRRVLSFAGLVARRQSLSLKLQLGRRLEVFDGDTGAGSFQIDRLLEIIAAMNTDRLPAIMLRNGDRIANRMVLVDADAILPLDRHIGLFIATAPKQIVAYAQIFSFELGR